MKKVMLSINGEQDCGGVKNVTQFASVAEYYENDGEIRIIYDDSAELGLEGVKSTLIISADGMVIMERGGGEYGNIVVEQGRRHICEYNTEYGQLILGIFGKSVENRIKSGVGSISMSYSIDVDSGFLSDNKIDIRLEEEV